MDPQNSSDPLRLPDGNQTIIFRLYVAGHAPNSVRARYNLKVICDTYLADCSQIEVVNILDEPMRALKDGILMIPTLVKIAPPPTWQIVGNLNDHTTVLIALGLNSFNPGDRVAPAR